MGYKNITFITICQPHSQATISYILHSEWHPVTSQDLITTENFNWNSGHLIMEQYYNSWLSCLSIFPSHANVEWTVKRCRGLMYEKARFNPCSNFSVTSAIWSFKRDSCLNKISFALTFFSKEQKIYYLYGPMTLWPYNISSQLNITEKISLKWKINKFWSLHKHIPTHPHPTWELGNWAEANTTTIRYHSI